MMRNMIVGSCRIGCDTKHDHDHDDGEDGGRADGGGDDTI